MADPVGLEIGTAEGITSEYLLSTIPSLKLYGVDPYPRYIDWNGDQPASEKNYEAYKERVKPYQNTHVHILKTSDDAVADFGDETLDFIFIDGLHTYEQVLKDCQNYWPKLKSGGVFIGHDYARIEDVYKAVNVFAKQIDKEIKNAQQDLWYLTK